jgi:hypothetical protein
MGNIIITGYTAGKDGVVLETNSPAKLKTGNVRGLTTWVSWDKIGALLFEDYTNLSSVASRDAIRNESTLQEEMHTNYCMPDNVNTEEEHARYLRDIGLPLTYAMECLKDDKYRVLDQHGNNHFQGSEIECMIWMYIKSKTHCL